MNPVMKKDAITNNKKRVIYVFVVNGGAKIVIKMMNCLQFTQFYLSKLNETMVYPTYSNPYSISASSSMSSFQWMIFMRLST